MNLRADTKSRDLTKLIFFISIIVGLGVLMAFMPRVSFPLIISFILSMILKPLIPTFRKLGIRKDFAIIFIFIGLGFFLIYPVIKIGPLIQQETQNFQGDVPRIEQFLNKNYEIVRDKVFKRTSFMLPENFVQSSLQYAKSEVSGALLKIPNLLASVFEWLFLIPLFLFFILRDGRDIKRRFLKLVPNKIFEKAYNFVYQFNLQIGDYIFAKFIEASIIGVVITSGLLIMDVRFAFLLGFIAAITNIIPYIGPFVGTGPGLVIAFLDHGMGPTFGGVFLLYVIANIIDLAFVFPLLVSKIVDLHPILVVVSVIIGSQFFGIIGMIISIPAAATLKLLFWEIYRGIYPDTSRET